MDGSSERTGAAVGAVLAGGRGNRIGGSKAVVELGGRALIHYPLAALEAAGIEPIVVAKRDSDLPPLTVPVIHDPDRPRHPLCGIVAALRAGNGRAVVVIACDMPFVPPALLADLAEAPDPLIVPALDGRRQPLLARYGPELRTELETALEREEPLHRTIESLSPRRLGRDDLFPFGDPGLLLLNVNDREDLHRAELALDRAGSAASPMPSRRRLPASPAAGPSPPPNAS